MSLSIYFTNQGHGTGRYLEDRGINVVRTASNKNACHRLWPKSVPPQTSNISTKSFSVKLQYQRKRDRVILQMPLLGVWPFLLLLLFWISIYRHRWDWPDGRSREWQGQERCYATRLFGSEPMPHYRPKWAHNSSITFEFSFIFFFHLANRLIQGLYALQLLFFFLSQHNEKWRWHPHAHCSTPRGQHVTSPEWSSHLPRLWTDKSKIIY